MGKKMEFVKGAMLLTAQTGCLKLECWLRHLLCGFEQLLNLSKPRFLHL